MTPKNIHKILIPPKKFFFLNLPPPSPPPQKKKKKKKRNIENQILNPQNMTWAYVCLKT